MKAYLCSSGKIIQFLNSQFCVQIFIVIRLLTCWHRLYREVNNSIKEMWQKNGFLRASFPVSFLGMRLTNSK